MAVPLHQLGNATWPMVAARSTPMLLIPVGSCEQHGPHLPLDTDTRIAIAIAQLVAAQLDDVLVGPAITISASGEHQRFAGTLSIGVEVMQQVLVELVRSADWCVGVVFIHGHGGNAQAAHGATKLLMSEGRRVLNWWPRLAGADAHAGRTETSLLLAIEPTLVQLEFAEAGRTEPLSTLTGELRRVGVAGVSPNGVLGDPSGASAAEGAQLLNALVTNAVGQITSWLL